MNQPDSTERRGSTYAFTTEKALIGFFAAALPRREVQSIIKQVKAGFIPRTGNATGMQMELQLLKKCEAELVRQVRLRQAV